MVRREIRVGSVHAVNNVSKWAAKLDESQFATQIIESTEVSLFERGKDVVDGVVQALKRVLRRPPGGAVIPAYSIDGSVSTEPRSCHYPAPTAGIIY